MNKRELKAAILASGHADSFDELIYEDFYTSLEPEEYDTPLIKYLKSCGILLMEEESYGGEGKGETYWTVFSCTHNGVTTYFKVDGWYASYEGGHYDEPLEFYEVVQKEVTVKKWVKR